jgi:Protein of unknown function (DUF3179)
MSTRGPGPAWRVVIGCVVLAVAAAVGVDAWIASRPRPPLEGPVGGPMGPTPFIFPAAVRPPAVPAAEADLGDDEPVIGVVMNGKARAYPSRIFSRNHVMNDLVGGAPVSVTHCDRTGCWRAFTGDGTEPLDIWTGGYADGLLLKVGEVFYHQETGEPFQYPGAAPWPYPPIELEKTTWGRWRAAHPDTDVSLGPPKVGSAKE